MTIEPSILDKLVSMTAVQDVELMEFSLLKTLNEFINPLESLILKLDRNGVPCYQLQLKQGKYEFAFESISLSEDIMAAIKIVSSSTKPFKQQLDPSNLLTVWNVLQSKMQDVFLVIITNQQLSSLHIYMMNGLLGVYRNFVSVLIEAQRDQLTGLPNRKTFEDVINRIYFQRPFPTEPVSIDRRKESATPGTDFWLGMADLDNFKRVNDTWGHLYGDEVLLLTSQLMQGHFRENDFLFRFGGEEFVIIIRAPNAEKAYRGFERFRMAIEAHRFPQVGQMTVSIGVTKMDLGIFSATLLDHADKALYYAKQNGRNQVCFFEELVDRGLMEETKFTPGGIELF